MSQAIKQEILLLAKHHRLFTVADIRSEMKNDVSRQYISSVINELVRAGELVRLGRGKLTKYSLPEVAIDLSDRIETRFKNNESLDEDRVYRRLLLPSIKTRNLPDMVRRIAQYSFTEIFNNAIDHSESKTIGVNFSVGASQIDFKISDRGIGIFNNIMQKHKLNDQLEAIQELVKGKVTTQKNHHSGEGIFFTSRAVDIFMIESGNYRYLVDNRIDDFFVERLNSPLKGTHVHITINNDTQRDLGDIFRKYQTDPEEGAFDITEIKVRLYKEGVEYISRSQAKRLLHGLDKYEKVILDFEDVSTIGQGFADEIFRVYSKNHPKVEIVYENTNREVQFMINRSIRR